MAQSLSPNLQGVQYKINNSIDWVIKVTDDITTWYFSQTVKHLGNIQTLDLLQSHSGIPNKIDIFNANWSLAPVTIKLDNRKYTKDSDGNNIRISDLLDDIEGKEVLIYSIIGSTVNSLDTTTEATIKFVGTVSDPISFTATNCVIKVKSITEDYNVGLPKLYMPINYPSYTVDPNSYKSGASARRIIQPAGTDMLPINYGTWSESVHGVPGVGMAMCFPISGSKNIPDVCGAAHPMKQVDKLWFTQENLDVTYTDGVSQFDSVVTTTQLSKTIITPSNSATVRIYPSGQLLDPADISADEETYALGTLDNDYFWGTVIRWTDDEVKLINDKDNSTYANLKDSNDWRDGLIDERPGEEGKVFYYVQGWNAITFPSFTDGSGLSSSNGIGEIIGTAAFEIYWTEEPGIDDAIMQLQFMHRKASAGSDSSIFLGRNLAPDQWHTLEFDARNGGGPFFFNLAAHYGWDYTYNKSNPINPVTQREPKFPLALVFRLNVPNSSGYSSVRNDQTLARINNANLKVPYKPVGINDFYVAGSGSMFGSYIDASGRSNDYNEGDLIQDPAFIIEDVLRVHVGVPDANIDTASFDAAANTNVKARLNIHADNKGSSDVFIKQITEQSTFAFCWTTDGRARLIPLNDKSPTTTQIVPFSHIKNGKIGITHTSKTYNVLNIQHKYLPEYGGIFQDFTQITHSGSVGAEAAFDSSWENITDSSATNVGNHLVGNSDSLLANKHLLVGIELLGATGIDLQLGDYIELDANTCDAQVQPKKGESWSGRKLLIYNLKHGMTSTKLSLIELYA